MKCSKPVRERFKDAHERHIADFPFCKKQWERFKYWFNHSNTIFTIIMLIIIWPLALIPTWLFLLAWNYLNPVLFWSKFATIVCIGGPATIVQCILLLPALILTFGVLAEAFDL